MADPSLVSHVPPLHAMADPALRPPPSPTAQWRHEIYCRKSEHDDDPSRRPPSSLGTVSIGRSKPVVAESKYPYLPDPFPIRRNDKVLNGQAGGFTSLREQLEPSRKQDETYFTYAEWWQAQRPASKKDARPNTETHSSSFWPYGQHISALATTDATNEAFLLDSRIVKNHHMYTEKRSPVLERPEATSADAPTSWLDHSRRSRSATAMMAQTAHPAGRLTPAGKPRQPFRSTSMATLSRGASSSPARSRGGIDAAAMGGSPGAGRYAPRSHNRERGLGSRIHAEWCLP